MLPFVNAWILRTHHLFAPSGGAQAGRLLELAFQLGLLPLQQLNHRSVLLLALNCPAGRPAGQAFFAEYAGRNLHLGPNQGQLGEALLSACLPPAGDLLRRAHASDGQQRGVLFRLAEWRYGPGLLAFLSRLFLLDLAHPRLRALVPGLLVGAWQAFLAQPGADYPTTLYTRALSFLGANGQGPPSAWPDPRPAWEAGLTAGERAFLGCCLSLSVGPRCLVYLSFYGGLHEGQVAALLQSVHPNRGPANVQPQLVGAWEQVLRCLAGPGPAGGPRLPRF